MSHLIVERRGDVALVTLNRPEKRNALSPEMVVKLADFWDEVAKDDDVRAVVVTGAGDQAFCAGGDMGSLIPLMMRTRPPEGEWEERFAADRKALGRALLRGASFYKPVIAAINGHAHAGGAEFVLATDLRVMAGNATLAVTEVRRGLIASGGSLVRMPRQVPWAHAMELLMLGEPVSAERAQAMGLVNWVVPQDQVLEKALDIARRVSLGAPVALEKTKEVMVRSSGLPLDEAFAIETQCTKENAAMDDAKEGPRAFMEKRPPVFRGRKKA
ncbi:enoyl-CoA hydratase-related protein [Ramlibacter sp. MAHUQ-53]|uniref:enoyl-CoA hydratase-related protein n=1 Tax=unclassified Ramlibacter TaxID=2617605 RepID=UPI0036253D8C